MTEEKVEISEQTENQNFESKDDAAEVKAPSHHQVNNSSQHKKKKQKPICLLCKRGCLQVNYKDVDLLKNYLKKYNKILTHKISGNCLKHQHQISNAIKRARFVALLPFVNN